MNDQQIKELPMCGCGKWPIMCAFNGRWFCGACIEKLMAKQKEEDSKKMDKWVEEIHGGN